MRSPRRHWYAREAFIDLRLSHWVQIFLTLALIFVGASQLAVYWRQPGISEVANEQNAVINQAFVYPAEINFVGPGSGITDNGEWNIVITWENSGDTPTVDLETAGNYIGNPVKLGMAAIS